MRPSAEAIFETLDVTWPAVRTEFHDGWRLRVGAGGGKRVSAATAEPDAEAPEIALAETHMRGLGQNPLFMIRPGEDELDRRLEQRGYGIVDPVTIFACECASLAAPASPAQAFEAWPPLAVQTEIWAEGGVGPKRIDIMRRAACPRTTLLGRAGDRPASTAYVGLDGEIAMLHALETRAPLRRQGAGRCLMHVAAHWAERRGARWLTLAVVTDNRAATSLYADLGMIPVTEYHYRVAKEVPR